MKKFENYTSNLSVLAFEQLRDSIVDKYGDLLEGL